MNNLIILLMAILIALILLYLVRIKNKLKVAEELFQLEVDRSRQLRFDLNKEIGAKNLLTKKLKFAIHNKPKHKIGKVIGDYEIMDIDVVEKGIVERISKGLLNIFIGGLAYALSKNKPLSKPELIYKYKVKNKITAQETWCTME